MNRLLVSITIFDFNCVNKVSIDENQLIIKLLVIIIRIYKLKYRRKY
jgi:hypothetical protein